jgi:3-methyl-2-indolic acid synthase
MGWFQLAGDEIAAAERRAATLAASAVVTNLAERARARGDLADEELAALFLSPRVSTDTLIAVARGRRPSGGPHLETFSPLYITNECDAECRMCGMRRTNAALVRERADGATVEAQLEILRRRGLRGVAILTGEYHHGAYRRTMIARAADAIAAALARGFTHVLINIGALEAEEYAILLAGVPRTADGRVEPRLTMCTFQETYSEEVYARFMGTNPDNPRSDFARRLTNFDRARDAGMWAANPGILLGLDPDVAYELLALLAHVRHLRARGMAVYVSVPRLRKASGTAYGQGVDDETLVRLVAVLSFGCPEAKVVISTRESPEMQRRLVPMIGVLTPGSPGVAPYTETGARFDVEASQFEVLDHRPIEEILGEFVAAGATIERFEAGRQNGCP